MKMDNLWFLMKAIFIGVVEGVTEFLPISSTGHMILFGHFIQFTGEFTTLFEIVIQLGAILAIVVLYRKKIIDSLRHLKPGDTGFQFWGAVVIGFIPMGILGFFFHDIIERYLFFPVPVAGALVVGGALMIIAEKKFRKSAEDPMKSESINEFNQLKQTYKSDHVNTAEPDKNHVVTWKQAAMIGLFQCLALVWPGFSRSASTIIGGWIVGLTTIAAAEFSFFLALPTMVIASGYTLLKSDIVISSFEWLTLGVGFITAFLVALLVVEKFIKYLKHKPMKGFAIYRIVVGVIILILATLKLI